MFILKPRGGCLWFLFIACFPPFVLSCSLNVDGKRLAARDLIFAFIALAEGALYWQWLFPASWAKAFHSPLQPRSCHRCCGLDLAVSVCHAGAPLVRPWNKGLVQSVP